MLFYIIRHGETNSNLTGLLQGWNDTPLNENGLKLAMITGRELQGVKFDHCISSPLIRAKKTAELILEGSGNDLPIEIDDRLKEIDFGDYELRDRRSKELELFFSDPFQCPQFPNGESVQMVMSRTQECLKELIKRDDDKTYLISTHGCALRAMLNFLYENRDDYWQGHVPYNCCVNIVEAKDGAARLVEKDKVYYPGDLVVDRYR